MSNYRETAHLEPWIEFNGYRFTELIRQEYGGNNCVFAAGLVEGHPHDSHYIWLEKDGEGPTILFLRPDGLATIAWLCSGALWSHLIEDVQK